MVGSDGIHLLDFGLSGEKMKLKLKIFFTFTAIAVIPLIIVSSLAYYQYTHIIDKRMSDIVSEQFDHLSQTVSTAYDSPKQALRALTFASDDEYSIINIIKPLSNPNQHISNYESYRAFLDMRSICSKICYTYNYISGIYVFIPSGHVISYETERVGRIPYDYDPSQDDWYQETIKLNGKLFLSTLDRHPVFGSDYESIFFAQCLKDINTNRYLGVIVVDCKPKLFDLSRVNALGNMNLITLVNTENQSVFYTNGNTANPDISSQTDAAFREHINGTPFELSLTFDRNSLIREYSIVGIVMIIVAILCILSVICLTYSISYNLVKPIQELSQQMLHQRTSHLMYLPNYGDRKDEIGVLYRQYNSMVEELNTSIKQDYQNKLIILDAQMKALEARINSHFLFNTLESINSMAELADEEQISTMSLALGNMFRYTIKTESELVTLQDELNHVLDYIAIQQIRYENLFSLEISIPEELKTEKLLKLILQPIVENTFAHGLDFSSHNNHICIQAKREHSNIIISVSDNGKGIPKDKLDLLQKTLRKEAAFTELGRRNKQSIGLKNIQSRIELYYGKGYGLSVQSEYGQGTVISIGIPILIAKEEA